MVFLKVKPDNISLQEYLGDFYHEAEAMSNNLGKLIDENEIEITSNWKIAVENTLESHHVALIHSETFQKLGASRLDFTFSKNHSSWDAEVLLKENEGKQEKFTDRFKKEIIKLMDTCI